MKVLRLLPLTAALGAALTAPAHAQGLLELYESARAYDAPWQSAKAQYEQLFRAASQGGCGHANLPRGQPLAVRRNNPEGGGLRDRARPSAPKPVTDANLATTKQASASSKWQAQLPARPRTCHTREQGYCGRAGRQAPGLVAGQKAASPAAGAAKRTRGRQSTSDSREDQDRYDW